MAEEALHYDNSGKAHHVEKAEHKIDSFFKDKRQVFIRSHK